MRKYLPPTFAAFLPMIAGCFAYGADSGGATFGQPVTLNWGSFITAYGPMAIMLGWFFYDTRERRKEEREQRSEWKRLLETNIEVLTKVKDTLTLTREDDEKHRTAIYRLIEEVRDIGVRIRGTSGSGNTRIMMKE